MWLQRNFKAPCLLSGLLILLVAHHCHSQVVMEVVGQFQAPVQNVEAMVYDPVGRIAYVGTGVRGQFDGYPTTSQFDVDSGTFSAQRNVPSPLGAGWINWISLHQQPWGTVALYVNGRDSQYSRGVWEINSNTSDTTDERRWYKPNTKVFAAMVDQETDVAYVGYEDDDNDGYLDKLDTTQLQDGLWVYSSRIRTRDITCGAIDRTNEILWFGTTSSDLVRVDLNPQFRAQQLSAHSTTDSRVGLDDTYCLAVDEGRDLLFVGQFSIGLLYKSSTLEFVNIFFLPETRLLSVTLDLVAGVSYWGTNTGNVLRVNYAPGDFTKVYDTLDINCAVYGCIETPLIYGGFVDSLNNELYFAASENPSKIVKVNPRDCTQFTTCSTCLQGDPNYCGWCSLDNSCTQLTACPSVNWVRQESVCPFISAITPTSGSVSGQTTVQISSVNVVLTNNTRCRFGNTDTAIQSISNGNIQCKSPPNVKGNVPVSIVFNGNPITNTITFNYYDCTASCRNCFSSLRLECGWCFSAGKCEGIASCSDPASFLTNPASFVCPELISVSPPSGSSAGGASLIIDGNGFSQDGDYQCRFGNLSSPATWISTTRIECITPSFSQGNKFTDLFIYRNGANFAGNSLAFYIYDCSTSLNCGTCLQPLSDCQYCAGTFTCTSLGAACTQSVETNRSACAEIRSLQPPSGHILGGTNVTVEGTAFGFESIDTFSCLFGDTVVEAEWISSSELSCISPPSPPGGPGLVDFNILYGDIPFTVNSAVFEYYECSTFDACSSCTPNAECVWCANEGCVVGSCSSELDQIALCPSITSIVPNHGPPIGIASITINGPIFPAGGNYSCIFAEISANQTDVTQAQWISEEELRCSAPPHGIGFVNVFIWKDSALYSDNSRSFEYFDCFGSFDCTSCIANPSSRCGWCRQKEECGEQDMCLSSTWSNSNCPYIESADPLNSDISGGRVVQIQGSLFSSNLELNCTFGNYSSPAIIQSDSAISCTVPSTETPGSVSLSLTHNGRPYSYNTPPVQFQYADCNPANQILFCDSCVASDELNSACGWCLEAPGCLPAGSCSLGLWTRPACPALRELSPLIGDVAGNTVISIEGSLLINHPTLQCSFGDILVAASFVNGSIVECTTPPGQGEVPVNLWLNGAAYTRDPLRFNYIANQPVQEGGSGDLLLFIIIAVVLFILALAGAAVILGLVYRRKKEKKKLVKPDLLALAFGNLDKRANDLVPEQQSSLEALEKFILKDDMEFVSILSQVTASTEQDMISKCLVYLFEYHDNALSLLSNAISSELEVSTQQTTFRSNSMATKMFAAYAKVVGLDYVWTTLALIVHELQDFTSQTSGYEFSGSEIKSLVHTSMEVDPNKVTEMDDIRANILQLQLIAQKIFDAIIRSGPQVPLQFRLLSGHIKAAFEGKFDADGNTAVGAFLFLRFFCPALTTPHTFGLLESSPTESCQRHLILVSKLLQNLSNGTMPGNKELYMQKMNEWINDNQGAMDTFINSISDPLTDEEMEKITPVSIPNHVKTNCMIKLHKHICMLINKINAVFEEQGKMSMRYELASLLDQMGPSPEEAKRDPSSS